MLRSLAEPEGYRLEALDGDVGDGCVSCHANVGHKNLRVLLDDHFDEVCLSEMPGDDGGAPVDPQTPAEEETSSEQSATSSEDA